MTCGYGIDAIDAKRQNYATDTDAPESVGLHRPGIRHVPKRAARREREADPHVGLVGALASKLTEGVLMGNCAAVDWASERHDVLVQGEAGETLLAATFAHDEAGLTGLAAALVRSRVERVAIERS